MNEIFFLVEEAVEGGYNARALGESIFTQGDNLDDLKANIRDAVQCHFDDNNIPKIIRLHLVKEEVITV
jgi:hypothetical protein